VSVSLQKIDKDSINLLSRLPNRLVSAAARCRLDGLQQTIHGAALWRDALLKGSMPTDSSIWPVGPIGQAIFDSFPRGLLRFTKGNEEVTDSVVENLLQIADGLRSDWDSKAAKELEDWLKSEQERRSKESINEDGQDGRSKEKPSKKPSRPITVKEKNEKLSAITLSLESELSGWAKSKMEDAWGEQLAGWNSILEVFEQLEGEASFGWNLSRGLLKHIGWEKVKKMNELLKSLPQISEIAKALGRAKASDNEIGPEERIMAKVSRVREELHWVEAPDARTHTDGIHKSDDIPRMLPMEGSLYLHPIFRKLWKAKFIERSLACYQIKGLEKRKKYSEVITDEEQVVRKKLERGPIILCLDTSGSMQGIPETVAKAITLEAMRLAHSENRDCLLYSFSGPGDVDEHDLSISPDGIESLCSFLCMSFHGGTDIHAPLNAATSRLEKKKWSRADIILISDGEFAVSSEILSTLSNAKKNHSLRVHGLLVSNNSAGSSEMKKLCEPLHIFREWVGVRGL
jgi:uncharacterized protein with von Willebrand factor type A (vWA) domain